MHNKKIRIAKLLSYYNQGSRREIEKLINQKKIYLNNHLVQSPVTFANEEDRIIVNDKIVVFKKEVEVFKFYKPYEVICSKNKQDNKKIIYEIIDEKFKNFIFAGRLDFKSEGLLILSNTSDLTRNLELPKNRFERKYEVRVFGFMNIDILRKKSQGCIVSGIKYRPFKFKIKSKIKKNTIIEMILTEGKKNEIREIFKSMNLQVNRLKRLSFGPFTLGNMKPGELKKLTKKEIVNYENYIGNKKG
jgi:23S rRNA pseudouridine2605 synthase